MPEKRKLNGRSRARGIQALIALTMATVLGLLAAQAGFGAGTESRLFVPRSEAAAGDEVSFRISHTEPGDEYKLTIGSNELIKGVDQDGDQLEDKFKMPNLGDAAQTVTIDLELLRVGQVDPIRKDTTIRYVLAGPTGPTSPVEAVAETPAAAVGPSAPAAKRSKPAAPKNTGTTGDGKSKAKKKTKSGTKQESGSNTDDSPNYVAPKVGSPLSTGGGGGGGGSSLSLDSATPPSAAIQNDAGPQLPSPSPSAPPPGIAGVGGVTAPPPPPSAPIAPTSTVDKGNGGNFDLPLWLVAVLGLLMLAGLGGAEARLLGMWGTPIEGAHSPDEARLLALARAASSGATTQQGIATRKGVRGNGAPAGKNGSRLKV